MNNISMFKPLFSASDKYLKQCKWSDIALLKFCLCAVGVLIGLNVTKEKRKCVQTTAILIFVITYIPLMSKFLPVLIDEFTDTEKQDEEKCDEDEYDEDPYEQY